MTTTIITRQIVPDSPNVLSIILTSPDPKLELVADYEFVTSAPGHVTIAPKYSYKERLRRAKTEFAERVKKLEQENEETKRERDILRRAQVYSMILTELSDVSWGRLPQDVCNILVLHSKTNLPNVFASWWLQWEHVAPLQFPLPPSMRHFGPVTQKSQATFILDAMHQESQLSKAIGTAWDCIPDTTRQLMLFCWAGFHNIRLSRNAIAHPDLSPSSVKEILNKDFNGNFVTMYATACGIVDYLF